MVEVSSTGTVRAAQITVAYSVVYTIGMLHQVCKKQLLIAKAEREGKIFDRYSSPQLLNADRLVANNLEWAPTFLAPVWSMAVTGNLTISLAKVAWTYVVLRGLYCVLVVRYGVAANGRNKPLWAATLPSYGCLAYLLFHAVKAVF